MGVQQSVAPLPDEKTTELFLRTAFGGKPEDARILIWTMPDKLTRTFANIDQAIAYVGECIAHKDVYFGVGTGTIELAPNQRYLAKQVTGLIGFHIDLDVADADAHKKKGLPPTKESALDFILSLGLEPTIVVDSGHGFHAHWLFDEPWAFDNSAERDTAAKYNRWWQSYARGMAMKEHAWNSDSTPDLARVLRVPGTMNWKVPGQPIPVTLAHYNPQAHYQLAQFLEVLEANQEIAKLPRAGFDTEHSKADLEAKLVLDENAEPPPLKFGKLTRENKLAYDAFEHETDLPSGSEYDFKLAKAALQQVAEGKDGLMHRTWTDQEVANLLIAHRRKWGFDLKRTGYYAITIANALADIAREDKLTEVHATFDASIQTLLDIKGTQQQVEVEVEAAPDTSSDEEDDAEDVEIEEEEDAPTSFVDDDEDGVTLSPEDVQRIAERMRAKKAGTPENVTPIGEKSKAKKAKATKQDTGILAVRSLDMGGADGEEARQRILKGLSDIYNPIHFVDIVKILSDPPQYRFSFEVMGKETSLTVKSLEAVVNMRSFRVAVGGATDILMKQAKQNDWDKHVQAMLSAARPEEIGEEATDVGLVNSWLNGYVESATIDNDWSGEYLDEGTRTIVPYKGDYYLFMSDVIYWLRVHRNERVTPQALGALFRTRGMDFIKLPMTRSSGSRTTKSAWFIPPNIIAPILEAEKKYQI